jgi:sigma-B regulation protein RsbU (phosphoserine phosphatase)
MFVTAILAFFNVRTGEMSVCSAGHNPMVVIRESTRRCELMNPGGIALGFDKGPVFDRTLREGRLVVGQGDRILMFTDGVVEAMNERREEYGEERFYRFVLRHSTLPSRELVRTIVRDLDEHKGRADQHDDITIVTFRAEGQARPGRVVQG